MLKKMLNFPLIYQSLQEAGGFFDARVKAMNEFLNIREGARIIDVGCGPGHIVKHIPKKVDYIGFDIDQSYIDFANKHFSDRGRFNCRFFDDKAAKELFPADIVMMNGVMHHMSDDELSATMNNARSVLAPGGLLFTLDGCYVEGQSKFRKWILDRDRGQYVRNQAGYEKIIRKAFDKVELHIREAYSHVPYTFVIGLASKSPPGAP